MDDFMRALFNAAQDASDNGDKKFCFSSQCDKLSSDILQIMKCEFCKNGIAFKNDIEICDAIEEAVFQLEVKTSESSFQAGFNVATSLFKQGKI